MNVTQLREALDDALSRGLHPETSVVVAQDGWYVVLSDEVEHPVDGTDRADLWFTLNLGDDADARHTPGHFAQPDPELHAEWQTSQADVDHPIEYVEWLHEQFDDLESLVQDMLSKDYEGRRDVYAALVRLEEEIERLG